MAQRQDEDLERLLKGIGEGDASYRSFANATVGRSEALSTPADRYITPLLSEIFDKGEIAVPAEEASAGVQPVRGKKVEALSSTRPVTLAPARRPGERLQVRAVAAEPLGGPLGGRTKPEAAQRSSLDDIRRILQSGVEKSPTGPVDGTLRGIFDRLGE